MGRPLQAAGGERRGDDAATRPGGASRRAQALVRRGEVRWAEHPDWPRRAALVLTRNEALDHLSEVLVVLATTNIRGLPTEVELGPADGMPRACVLNADQVASLDCTHEIAAL